MSRLKEELDNIIDNQRIETFFQHVVSLKNGYVIGFEALSRITGESLIKNTEELFQLSDTYHRQWDLEKLCRVKAFEKASTYIEESTTKLMFLNVNPNIINDPSFVDGFTIEQLKLFKLNPDNFVFEITERCTINNMSDFKKMIAHYKNQDIKIAMDDVGAGYSGLNLISAVNPHFIKLDREIITNLHKNLLKQAIVRGMVELAKQSNIKIIAEGIEIYEELQACIELGVDYGQGYYLRRPENIIRPFDSSMADLIKKVFINVHNKGNSLVYTNSLAHLSLNTISVPTNYLIKDVHEIMKQDPACYGICILKDNIPVGIITRSKLNLAFSSRFGYKTYRDKPIESIMDQNFIVFESNVLIHTAINLALKRDEDNIYDFIVVTNNDEYEGTVSVRRLFQHYIEQCSVNNDIGLNSLES